MWQKASSRTVADVMKEVDVEEFDGFEPVIETIVNKALRSEPAARLNELIIDHFLAENGEKSLQQLLLDVEITEEDVQRESVELFGKIIERALEDGSLEERIREHLQRFYGSDEVAAILA